MLLQWLLLAAPGVAALLLWGSWPGCAVALLLCAGQYAALRETERFSARVWRTVGVGRRSRRARVADAVYLLTVVAGLLVLGVAVVRAVGEA